MEWTIIGANVLYAVTGVVPWCASSWVIDRLTPEGNLAEELHQGNEGESPGEWTAGLRREEGARRRAPSLSSSAYLAPPGRAFP